MRTPLKTLHTALQTNLLCLLACFMLAITPPAIATKANFLPFLEPQFEQVSEVDILDKYPINTLAQDTRGLIWIGTQAGLIRYDGYTFRKFSHKIDDPYSLAGDNVTELLASTDGRIWVGTNSDGLSVFDPRTERFENFRHNPQNPNSLINDQLTSIAQDQQGGIWLATHGGISHLPPASKRFVHFTHSTAPNSLIHNQTFKVFWDKHNRLWVGSSNGLQRLAKDGKSFETIATNITVYALFQAQDGKLWLGTRKHGAAWLMPNNTSPTANTLNWLPLTELNYPRITDIAQVRTDQIWLATDHGITVVAASNGQVMQTLKRDEAIPSSLALDDVSKLLLDRAGWLWVATFGGGLQRTNTQNDMIRVLRRSPNLANGLSDRDVRSILELNNGQILFGIYNNGIDVFDRQRGLVDAYRPTTEKGATPAGSLPDANINSMIQTDDGTIWAATQQTGVVRLLAGSKTWEVLSGLPDLQVNILIRTREGGVLAGTARGLAHWQTNNANNANKLTPANPASKPNSGRFELFADKKNQIIKNGITDLAQDQQGRIWIGTETGLWLYEPQRRELIAIKAEPKRPSGLISNSITSLLCDSHDRIWISTDKGLERLHSLNDKQAHFEHISALIGQPGKFLGSNLLEDAQGRIWTDQMVLQLPTKGQNTMRMMPISKADGMDISDAWGRSYAKTRDGLLLQGGFGVAVIDPSRFKAYSYNPPLVITELKINGQTIPPANLANLAQSLTLTPAQRNFAIEFAALDYSKPKNNRYQYRLQGYDKTWIDADAAHRNASYGNLWPGLYTLQIRGSNRIGDWSVHELAIPIRVLPAWWQTWWFAAAMLLSLSALFASLIQARTRYLRQRQLILKQQVDERTAELHQKQLELVHANADLVLSVETLRQLGDIGREITANLDANIVFQSLYMYVGSLLHAPTMTIYRMNASTATLDAVFGREDDHAIPIRNIALNSPTSNAARAVRERQVLLFNYDLQDKLSEIPGTRHMLTALFAPLIVDNKVLGVMSIQSDRENAYGERECLIFRTLSAYGAIALANATAMGALHEAQGQLVQQEKMASLGNLVTSIAHEINTPLGNTLVAISGVEGAWKTLQNAVANGSLSKSVLDSSTAEGMEYTALALKTAGRAAELIALFKTISVNPDSDRITEIELVEYLQEVSSLVHSRLAQQNIQLDLIAPSGARIYVVPEALTETLSRIMANALDHGFANGRTGTLRLCAQFEASEAGEEVIISVSDNGHGIAAEDLPKVFDPFFTTKSGLHGHVGLGLHVAYNHVTQRLKGRIHITSTLDKETRVEIRLKQNSLPKPSDQTR